MTADSPPEPAAPLEAPTGSRRVRPVTAWILGLFAAVSLATILRYCLTHG